MKKIGRNDPCPCRSGKKYKHCCQVSGEVPIAKTHLSDVSVPQVIQGALYFPSQSITYNGNGTSTAICTRFVSRRIIFSGTSAVENKFEKGSNCAGAGLDGVEGGRLVRLVA